MHPPGQWSSKLEVGREKSSFRGGSLAILGEASWRWGHFTELGTMNRSYEKVSPEGLGCVLGPLYR